MLLCFNLVWIAKFHQSTIILRKCLPGECSDLWLCKINTPAWLLPVASISIGCLTMKNFTFLFMRMVTKVLRALCLWNLSVSFCCQVCKWTKFFHLEIMNDLKEKEDISVKKNLSWSQSSSKLMTNGSRWLTHVHKKNNPWYLYINERGTLKSKWQQKWEQGNKNEILIQSRSLFCILKSKRSWNIFSCPLQNNSMFSSILKEMH